MENNFDPKKLDTKEIDPNESKRQEKQIRRKRWYRTLCGMAAVVVMCTVYTLMLPALTLDNDTNNGGDSTGSASVENVSDSSTAASETGSADSASSNSSDSADSNTDSNNNESNSSDSSADKNDADGTGSADTNTTGAADNSTSPDADSSAAGAPADTNNNTADDANTDAETPGTVTGASDSDPDQIIDDSEATDAPGADSSADGAPADTPDPTADLETETDWTATLHDTISADNWDDLTWGEKLIAVAETQLGYTESTQNYIVDDEGNHKGYTRYGAWYGNPYGDWCAMFASFCLNYAGIDPDAIPHDANCSNWVKELKKLEIYEDKDLYTPEPGDIVFFDQEGTDHANHVGIIAEVEYGTKTVTRHITKDGSAVEDSTINLLKYINTINTTDDDASGDQQPAELETTEVEIEVAESIKVIEGNSSDRVQYVEYEAAADNILGYVSLENAKAAFENSDEEQPEEDTVNTLQYKGDDYTIKIKYTDEANIPEGTELQAEELKEGTDEYDDYYSRAAEKLMENSTAEDEEDLDISFARFFDIKLMYEGEEIEPAAPVTVRIAYSDRVEVADDQQATVIHFAKEVTAENDSSWTTPAAMSMPAALALDDEDSTTSDDSAVNSSASADVTEVPELIEPKEVKNSVFEFEQSSFSVTATVISSASNTSFVDGGQYVIYYTYTDDEYGNDGKTKTYAISHSNDEISLKRLNTIPKSDGEYSDNLYSTDILWTYEVVDTDKNTGAFYYMEGDSKKYFDISESWNGYSINISDKKPTSGLIIANGNISKKIGSNRNEKEVYVNIKKEWFGTYSLVAEEKKQGNKSTSFNFAMITKKDEVLPTPEVDLQKLTHHKYVKKSKDKNTYDLTLTVTGAKGSIEDKAKLDIVFILDVSGSMKWSYEGENDGSNERLKKAVAAIKTMSNALSNNQNLDVTYSLVTFSGDGDTGEYNDAVVELKKGYKSELDDALDNAEANGGTNYEAGLLSASTINSREGAQKAIIFVSDGNPTFYYSDVGITTGDGDKYEPQGLRNAQIQLSKMSMDYFYAIGVGSNSKDYIHLSELIKDEEKNHEIDVLEANRGYFSATDNDKLTKAFSDIVTNITQVRCKNVSITDPLSEYAEPTTDATLVIKRFSIDGSSELTSVDGTLKSASLTFEDKLNSDAINTTEIIVNATYDAETKTIKLIFPNDYELNPAYEFTVTLQIQPTDKAIEGYMNSGYNAKGDSNTDAPDIAVEDWTSSGKPGFYSNEMNAAGTETEAVVTYKYTTGSAGIQTEYYDKPVIQVEVESFELPETGGMGTPLIYLIGAAIIAAPTTIIAARRRRKQN